MFGPFPDKHQYQELVKAGDRLFAVRDARLSPNEAKQRASRAVGCWAFVHGLAMLAIDDQLRMHLPGTDETSLLEIIGPMVDSYVGSRTERAT